MTDHPCKGMSPTQIAAFEAIAVNQPPQCGWRSIDKLLERGVIKRGPVDTRRDAMGTYTIPSFFVPAAAHAQWCAWCSEQPSISAGKCDEA